MAAHDGSDKIAALIKQACPPAAASPEFKARLRQQLRQQAGAPGTRVVKPLWQQPFVWISAAGASAVAAALIVIFVVFQSVPPTVATRQATGVQSTSATLNGRVSSLGESDNVGVSFEWGTTTNYGQETTPQLRTESGDITANLSGLRPNATYHYRLKVVGPNGTKYGPDMQFTTGPAPPTATTMAAAEIKTDSATLRGSLDDLGSATSVTVYFEWGTTPYYGHETTPESKPARGVYTAHLTGLTPGTTYYYRAKADGDTESAYGAQESFTMLTAPPWVATSRASGITTTSATLNGDLKRLGTAGNVTVCFEWGAISGTYAFTTAEQVRIGTGDFSADLSGLTPGTTYYYRAKVAGDGAPVYGQEDSFTTSTSQPSVTTNRAIGVTTASAILNGDLKSLGTAGNVTVCFEWGTASGAHAFTTADQVRIGTGDFSADLSGLAPGTTYYYRAKADGDGAPVYGSEEPFTTSTAPPLVATSSATGVHCTWATLNGLLDSPGTAENVQVSFEWGLTKAYGNYTEPAVLTATGTFSAYLEHLLPGTTYHFRAKAVGDGTAQGADMMFTTGQTPPAQATWYLSNDDPGCPRLMYEGDTSKDARVLVLQTGRPLEWRADQPSEGVAYPAGTWTVQVTLSRVDGDHQVAVWIGVWRDDVFEVQGEGSFNAQRDGVYVAEIPMSSFTPSPGTYVAVKMAIAPGYGASAEVRVGEDSSWLKSPSYPEPLAPTVTTGAATSVEAITAILDGDLNDLGSVGNVTVYFEWGTTTDYGNDVAVASMTSDGSFSVALNDLTPNTTYHFRAKAAGDGVNYGIDMTFQTSS